jgi:hypothetical protein
MPNTIVTVTHNLPAWSEITLGRMQEYQARFGCGLVALCPKKYSGFMDRAALFKDALNQFGRCAFIDADCVISREAPDIFAAHPEGSVWMVSDSPASDEKNECPQRFQDMMLVQAVQGAIGWIHGYGNMGVVLCDAAHAEAFDNWLDVPGTHHDQAQFNYHARKLGYPMNFMDRKWNSMGIGKGLTNQIGTCRKIAEGAFIAHAAGFRAADRKYAIETFDRVLP